MSSVNCVFLFLLVGTEVFQVPSCDWSRERRQTSDVWGLCQRWIHRIGKKLLLHFNKGEGGGSFSELKSRNLGISASLVHISVPPFQSQQLVFCCVDFLSHQKSRDWPHLRTCTGSRKLSTILCNWEDVTERTEKGLSPNSLSFFNYGDDLCSIQGKCYPVPTECWCK